jgi:hypothetical protein
MDLFLLLFLLIGFVALAVIIILGFSLVLEVKKTRKTVTKLIHLINQSNTTLIHQTSKLDIIDRQLRIIGSKLVPEKYKRRTARLKSVSNPSWILDDFAVCSFVGFRKFNLKCHPHIHSPHISSGFITYIYVYLIVNTGDNRPVKWQPPFAICHKRSFAGKPRKPRGPKRMKAPRSRADRVSGYRDNVYYIAAPRGGISASLQQAEGN